MEAYVDTLCSSHNQKKDNNKFKNKKQPELTENQTLWMSNNQDIKEETFTQMSRRGRDRQLEWGGLSARRWLARWAVPHLHGDKPGGTTGEQDRPCNPGFHCGEIKVSKPLTKKNLWGLRQQEKLPASQESWLEGCTGFWNVHKPTHPGISTRRAQFACG